MKERSIPPSDYPLFSNSSFGICKLDCSIVTTIWVRWQQTPPKATVMDPKPTIDEVAFEKSLYRQYPINTAKPDTHLTLWNSSLLLNTQQYPKVKSSYFILLIYMDQEDSLHHLI